MATAIQWRRGTTSQHSSFTGLVGEITIDTDLNTVIVHDGSTAGGHRLAKHTEVTSAAAGDISSIVAGNGLSGGATTGDATLNLDTTSATFTGGVQTFLAGGTLAGHVIPATTNTYDLGSTSKVWRDVYIGPGSLYVNGQKVLEDDSGTITVTADANQNLSIKTTGSGDVELNASGTGVINLQSGITVDAGQVLTGTSGLTMGSNINFNSNSINNLDDPVEAQDGATKAYVDAQILTKDNTDEMTEGSTNLYFTNARADARIANAIDTDVAFGSASNSLVPSQLAVKTYVDAQVDTADALSELSGDTDDITEGSSNLFFNNTRARAAISVTDAGGDGSLGYSSGVLTYTGPSAAETRAHISGGTGITVTDGVIATTITQYTEALSRGDISVTDAGGDGSLAYNSTTGVITYTGPSASEVRAHITAGTGITITDGAIATSITQYADSDARSAVSVTDAGGDGSLAYNSTSGVITYTGPSASEVRAHFSGGSGIDISSGSITADSTVVRTTGTQTVGGAKTFSDDLILSGNLTVNGTQTIVNTETLTVDDNMIVLNNNESGTPSEDSGIEVERGTSTNVKLQWSESGDRWEMYDGSSTYILPRTTADLTENTNLYYTDARADARVAAATGSNLNLGSKDTDDLSEGSSNLYFTDARADARVDAGFTAKDTADLSEGTNLYFTNARADARITNALVDEDNMASDSATKVPSQQSVKAYVDAQVATKDALSELSGDTDDVSEGSSNLYFTAERVADTVGAMVTSNTESGITVAYDDADNTLDFTVSLAGFTTANLSENTNLYYTDSRARNALSGGTGISYNSSTGAISLTDTGYVTGVTAGTGLSGGGTSGTVTLNVSGITVSELAAGSLQTSGESFGNDDTSLMTSAAIEDKILSYGYSTTTGDITSVTAGDGLTGGASSGGATLTVGAGTGITVNTNDIAVNMGDFSTSNLSEGTNEYHTAARVNTLIDARVTNSFVDALNVDADTLDGISSASFLRADANDSHSGDITPSSDNAVDLGSSSLRYNEVYAVTFQGTATSAQYADLAEKYESNEELEAGTVVCFAGDKEVTACGTANDHRVAGVISTDPAYMMNAGGDGQYVALTGRVPTKVTGPVAKGDLMVSSDVKGHAKADNNAQAGRIIGKAVGSNDAGEGVIEVLVNMM
ncbi:hypothetical protein OAQ62_00230 [bacterium]|nr:hypothetical protein [bacterium]